MQIPAVDGSLWSHWKEILVALVANWVLVGVVVRAVAKDQFMATFDRCTDQVVAVLNRAYRARDERIESKLVLVDAHEDRLRMVDASLLQQGKALGDQINGHFAATTKALETMSLALVAIQEEAKATAIAVGEIRGELRADRSAWDGTERRTRRRRRPSQA